MVDDRQRGEPGVTRRQAPRGKGAQGRPRGALTLPQPRADDEHGDVDRVVTGVLVLAARGRVTVVSHPGHGGHPPWQIRD